jgi:hypothetical protein
MPRRPMRRRPLAVGLDLRCAFLKIYSKPVEGCGVVAAQSTRQLSHLLSHFPHISGFRVCHARRNDGDLPKLLLVGGRRRVTV